MKDLMLLNGEIYTMNPKQPRASAVAVRDSKIIAVGKTSDVENLGKRNFKVINLQGETVVPGFIDCHTHFFSFALSLNQANLDQISSFEQILSEIKTVAKNLKPKEWLLGRGWDKNILKKGGSFTKEVLDKICPNNPVALRSKDHHLLWVNSLALKLAEIDKYTEDPPGGEIDCDPISLEPTGILKENACELVWKKISSPSPEQCERLLKEAMKKANSFGLTGIHNFEEQKAVFLFQKFLNDNELSLRVCFWISKEDLDSAISLGLRSGFGEENIRFGGVKLYSDGALGSQTALMFEPYENSEDNFGIEVTSQEELTDWVKKASQSGISVAIHAIGDKGVHQALNAIKHCGGRHTKTLRQRIEHIQLLHPQDLKRFSKLGVIASVQPYHATSDRDIADKYWGKRTGFRYPYKSLLNHQTKLVFGSDLPIETMDPLKIIYAAVSRKKEGERRTVRLRSLSLRAWYPQECLSLPEAVFAYTQGASFASYEEKIKGSVEIGKLADMVVLSKDIFEVNPEEILDTKVESTILGGKIVTNFEKE
ncbi:MAG: amidohydrolase [candidate division Zixibacteria bacterium]|nr:amidohydrolase [candidate division Zixibacteria bacterium]